MNDRKPVFGDLMQNKYASEDNPHRYGYFVRAIRRNVGLHYELTDKKGHFWETDAEAMVLVGEKGK
ncbi:hypothetical protein [Proteus mirabilis]|uniref:hypothetical protein n=1 Tax=Proteus mirabilis TaxID=584 RepID=UPI0013994021|nr:hypothetical protein [Proteus mirabilis]QHZ89464.1 hypothetical protein GYM49_10240 [Proteus mirabilis]